MHWTINGGMDRDAVVVVAVVAFVVVVCVVLAFVLVLVLVLALVLVLVLVVVVAVVVVVVVAFAVVSVAVDWWWGRASSRQLVISRPSRPPRGFECDRQPESTYWCGIRENRGPYLSEGPLLRPEEVR